MRKRAEILSIQKAVDTCLVDTFGNDFESLKNQLAFLPLHSSKTVSEKRLKIGLKKLIIKAIKRQKASRRIDFEEGSFFYHLRLCLLCTDWRNLSLYLL